MSIIGRCITGLYGFSRWRGEDQPLSQGRLATKSPLQSAAALPRNLKRLMAEREMEVPTLAATAQVSASTIRHYLRGGGYDRGTPEASPNPTLTTLLAVAQAMGVGIGDLVEERES